MKRILLLLLIILTYSNTSYAGNEKTKTLKGQVLDSEGAPLIGAKVTLKGTDLIAYSGFDGEFTFPKISPTILQVSVSMPSYEETNSTIEFQPSRNNIISITLESK